MSQAFQNFVVEPEGLRKLNSDFEIAWSLVRSSMESPPENEDEAKFGLAKILIGLAAETTQQQDLALKAAAQWLENPRFDGPSATWQEHFPFPS